MFCNCSFGSLSSDFDIRLASFFSSRHRIQQGTNKLANDTTVCLKRMINLQGGSVSERVNRHVFADFENAKIIASVASNF